VTFTFHIAEEKRAGEVRVT